jgi:hypothetical protein
MDSNAYFFGGTPFGKLCGEMWAAGLIRGEPSMTLANRLSVVAAYIAFAFVGAIVLGVF